MGASDERSDHTHLLPSPATEAIKTNGTAALQGSERQTQKVTTAQQTASRIFKTHRGGFFSPLHSVKKKNSNLCAICTYFMINYCFNINFCSPWSSAEVEKRLLAAAFYSSLLSACETVAAAVTQSPDNNSSFFSSLSGLLFLIECL